MKKFLMVSAMIGLSAQLSANGGVYMECVYTNSQGGQQTQGAWVEDTHSGRQQFFNDCSNNLNGDAQVAAFEPVVF